MRVRAEWLVLPLLLLPILAAGGLILWARQTHEADLAPYQADPRQQVAMWLSPPDGVARWIPELFLREFAPGGAALGDAGPEVAFDHPWGPGRVGLGSTPLGAEGPDGNTWVFEEGLPGGIAAHALIDPATRLQVETGKPIAFLDGVDEATAALRDLLARSDLQALRRAPLPASTKAFLLRRWRHGGDTDPAFDEALVVVEAVRHYETALASRGVPFSLGVHEAGRLVVVASDGTWPPLLLSDRGGPALSRTYEESAAIESPVRLAWIFPPEAPAAGSLLWRGRMETPLAGTFAFTARRGAWWEAPRVRRWAGPAALLLLAFLTLPIALWVILRRRQKLDQARVRFINEMAHDLRTPLASLRLHVDMLCEGKGKPDQGPQYLRAMSREAARLTSLLANLLDLSRLEEQRREWKSEGLALRAVLDTAARDFRTIHPQREEDLRLEGPPDIRVQADADALGRVLANLLENAGKHTDAGTEIRITWRANEDEARLVVADDGKGVEPRERRRIFDRYARGTRARRDGVPGSGLGLALVRELVEGMGGTVRLLDTERGAAFEVSLPRVHDA